jgi:hypothetical protein
VSTLSHAAGAILAHAALRFGDAGALARGALRHAARRFRDVSGLRPVSTGTSTFDPAAVALGMSPLAERIARRVDPAAVVAARRRNYFLLLGHLREHALPVFGELPPGVCPLFYPLVCEDKAAVRERLLALGVEAIDFWRTGHALCPPGAFPEVDRLRRTVLELPIHQDLGPEEVAHVARCAEEALR